MIFDTHVHYNLDPLYPEWQRHWQEAQSGGVSTSVVVGTDRDSINKAVEISAAEPNLYAAVGFHPTDGGSTPITDDDLAFLRALIAQHKKIVAIGECGLDYHHAPFDAQKQKVLFGKQIQMANELGLPLIIHSRDAEGDMLDVINHFSKDFGKPPKAVLHCMSGTLDYLQQALTLGFFISFAGNVTYKNAQSLRELASHTPLDRILIETDAPYLSPQSKRGQINAPKSIMETANALAAHLNLPLETFAQVTNANARRFFRLQ